MQNRNDMDLEYAKPVDEYTKPREYAKHEYDFQSNEKKKESSAKSIKKLMMFASASVLTVNIVTGQMFVPEEEVTDERLKLLTPYMAELFPLVEQQDTIGINKYIESVEKDLRDIIQIEDNTNDSEVEDDYYFNSVSGVYSDVGDECLTSMAEMTQEMGFAFYIYIRGEDFHFSICSSDVKNGRFDGELYEIETDGTDHVDEFNIEFKNNTIDSMTSKAYVKEEDVYRVTWTQNITRNESTGEQHITTVYSMALDGVDGTVEFSLDEDGQLIYDNDELIYDDDGSINLHDNKYKYVVEKGKKSIFIHSNELMESKETSFEGSQLRIVEEPLGVDNWFNDYGNSIYELYKDEFCLE